MKDFVVWMLVLVIAGSVFAAPPMPSYWDAPSSGTPYAILSGEHSPLIWTGTIYLRAATAAIDTSITPWMQIGYSTTGNWSGITAARYNPEEFTATLRFSSNGDSVGLSKAYFECAYDTSGQGAWNGDTSNVFIVNNAYNRTDYGSWTFEDFVNTTAVLGTAVCDYSFPLRILRGGYTRLVFIAQPIATGLADSTTINWTFIAEH